MRGLRASLAAILCAWALDSAPIPAQEHPNQARGILPQNAFSTGGIDTVNGMNGGLTLSIPLGQSYPMNGGWSYSFGLSYSSNFWKYTAKSQNAACGGGSAIEARVDPSFNAGAGWTFSMGRLFSPLDSEYNESGKWIYVDPGGGRHTFYSTLHDGEGNTGDCGGSLGCSTQYTRDGSYLRLRRGSRMVEFPGGQQHIFAANSYLFKIQDRNGNWAQFDTPETFPTRLGDRFTWTISDSLGRSHTATFEVQIRGQGGQLVGLSLDGFGGADANYTFSYDNDTLSRTDKDTWCGNNSGGTSGGADPIAMSLLKKVMGPELLVWSMEKTNGHAYYFRPAGTGYPQDIRAGVIESLKLPTGGSLSWTWRTWVFPAGKNSFRDTAAGVATKNVYDPHEPDQSANWTYTSELCPKVPPEETTAYCEVTGTRPNEVISVIESPQHTKFIRYFTANTYDGTANSSAGGENANWDYGLPFSCREENSPPGSRQCISTAIIGSGPGVGRQRSTWVHFTRDKKPTVAGDPGPGTFWNLNRRIDYSRLKFDDDGNGRYKDETFTNFDGLGHYRAVAESGQFTTSNWRQTTTQYDKVSGCYDINLTNENQICNTQQNTFDMPGVSSSWILDRFSSVNTNEGGIIARREFSYMPNDGPLDCYRILAGPPNNGWVKSGNDVYVDLTYSAGSQGNPDSEKWYGGDGANISTAAGCSVAGAPSYEIANTYSGGVLASTKHVGSGITHYDYQATIDTKTGLPSAVFDPSGFKTTLSYDLLGRVTEVTPVGDANTWDDGAKTSLVYSFGTSQEPRTHVTWSRSCPAVQAACGESFPQGAEYFDGFGRQMQERLLRPDGTWVNRYSQFNISGWRLRDSEWTPDGQTVHYTEYRNFDPLGRPREVYSPDRPYPGVPAATLTYYGERQLDREVSVATALDGTESLQKTTYIWDAFGRLKSVSEPSSTASEPAPPNQPPIPANGQVLTTYGYDVGGRLVSVTTPTSLGATQQRRFKYDHRGFLRFESLPEKAAAFDADPSPTVTDNYSVAYTYDARGNVTSIQDGSTADWQKLTYDKAERLLEVKDGAAADRLLKRFTYDIGSSGLALSKVTKSERWNYFDFLGQASLVTQSFSYSGVEGRISSRTTGMSAGAIPWSGGTPRESFAQSFTWNRAGELVGQSYPICSGGSCPAGGQTARSATSSYARGFLTASTYDGATVATLSYHPSGLLNQVLHNNSTLASQKTKMVIGADPAGMARPGDLNYYKGSSLIGAFGTFAYDGAGNIKAQSGAASHFRYDGVSRLAEAELGFFGGPFRQSYTYDRFGNIGTIATQVGAGSLSTVNTPTDPVTNRLTSGNYDGAGNMKSYITGSQEYYYDAFGQTYRSVKGSENWIYVYSADGERLWSYRTNAPGSYFTARGLGGEVLRETALHLGGNSFTDFVYGAGLLAKFDASGARTDYHVDHLGTPRLAVNATGGVQRYYMYYPYGQEFNVPLSADTFRLRFTGHERDLLDTASAADDNEYHHARNFSLTTARYHSPDPVRGDLYAPQHWNLFSYVGGNPLNRTDPFGLDWCTVVQSGENGKEVTRTFWCEGYDVVDEAPPRGGVGGAGGGGVDGGRHGPWGLLDRILDGLDRMRRFSENCGGVSIGISVSGVAPVAIDGGEPVLGVVGFNLQLLPGAIGLFMFGTREGEPPAYPSAAFGASVTSNVSFGSGSWRGPFRTIAGNGGLVAVEGFMSPSGLSWNSWQGIGGGLSAEGLPVGGVLSTNDFSSFLVLGPNSGPCGQ